MSAPKEITDSALPGIGDLPVFNAALLRGLGELCRFFVQKQAHGKAVDVILTKIKDFIIGVRCAVRFDTDAGNAQIQQQKIGNTAHRSGKIHAVLCAGNRIIGQGNAQWAIADRDFDTVKKIFDSGYVLLGDVKIGQHDFIGSCLRHLAQKRNFIGFPNVADTDVLLGGCGGGKAETDIFAVTVQIGERGGEVGSVL